MNDLGPLVEAFAKIEPWRGTCTAGCVGNFLGVMIDLEFIARHHPSNTEQENGDREMQTFMPKVEDGEHFLEFAAIHKAVHAARDRFVMVELGGGYAARSVDTYRTLQKLNPMPCQLVIVEAEPTHFEWVKRHLKANGINPRDHWLIKAAVSVNSDPKLFMLGSGVYYNGIVKPGDIAAIIEEIVKIDNTEQALRTLMTAGRCGMQVPYDSAAGRDLFDYEFVSTIPLADILAPLPHVDLMDIDIQGAEDTAITPAMDLLDSRVKRVHIGTHGADIHRGLWDLFFEHEWVCEFDYPPFNKNTTPWGDFETMDGVLHLYNPRL